MPRNGSGVASKPAGTTAVPNTTVESAKYNSTIDDIYALFNEALPVVAGGTGATSAASARTNLGFATTAHLYNKKGADVASASTLTLGDDGNYFDITGTTTITAIATKGAGTVVKLHFDASLTLTHHATDLILPDGINITTAAGDEAEFVEYATGDWRLTSYLPASSSARTIRFRANKNGTDQTSLGATPTKLTFTTEEEDVGGYYDAANSRFTPLVAGTFRISAGVFNSGTISDNAVYQLHIYKNGSLLYSAAVRAPGTNGIFISIDRLVSFNGSTDYVEIYYQHAAAGGTVLGTTAFTYFEGSPA